MALLGLEQPNLQPAFPVLPQQFALIDAVCPTRWTDAEVACWEYALWKFVEAGKSDRRAAGVLVLVQKLYRVEKRVKSVCRRFGRSFDSPGKDGGQAEEFRRRWREKQPISILSANGDWLLGPECSTALPKSSFSEAVGYCLNNWLPSWNMPGTAPYPSTTTWWNENTVPRPWDGGITGLRLRR